MKDTTKQITLIIDGKELSAEVNMKDLAKLIPAVKPEPTNIIYTASKIANDLALRYKCSSKDFDLVSYEKDGKIHHVVLYTGMNGIDLGNPKEDYDKARSWDAIMDDKDDKRFIIEVDGTRYDTRQGMTGEAYAALIQAKKDAGEDLPDSAANKLDGTLYTWTLLTGEQAVDVRAPVARVNDVGSVGRVWDLRGSGRRAVRVRPAVKL